MERYDSYKDSGVKWLGKIPSHWEILPGLAVFKENKTKNTELSEKTVLSLSYGNIIIKKDIDEGLVPADYKGYQIVHPGYIIIRCTDLQNDKVSLRTGLVKNDGIITGAYLGLKVDGSFTSSYVHYFLHSWDITKEIYRHGSGLRQSLSWFDLRRLPILIPSREEQNKIVSYLNDAVSKIDEAIAQQQKMIDLLNERKQIIINHAVTKGLAPNVPMKDSGIDWLGSIPAHWELRKLKHIYKRIADGTHFSPVTVTEGLPYITATDVNGRGLNYDTVKRISYKDFENLVVAGCRINKGDILIVKDGATTGRVGIKMDDVDCVALSSVAMLTPSVFTDNNFLMYAMMSDMIKKQIDLSMAGAAMPRITLVKLSNYVCTLPCYDEQKMISDYIDSKIQPLDNAVKSAKEKISLLQERKQIIINDVVTGKVKVV